MSLAFDAIITRVFEVFFQKKRQAQTFKNT